MRILLTNDDGIEAPGIEALRQAAEEFGELVVAAPLVGLSGCGHQTTTQGSIDVKKIGPDRYSVDGTPADCTRVALHALEIEVDLVLSGINAGGNMGVDTYESGTVAAAREAVLLGIPAIAVSQYVRKDLELVWDNSIEWTRIILREWLGSDHLLDNSRPVLWSINLPHLPPSATKPDHVRCQCDHSPHPVKFQATEGGFTYTGNYHDRPRLRGSDVDVCMGGQIAVTRLL